MSGILEYASPFSAAPKLVEFYVSSRCHLRCTHCFHGKPVHVRSPLTLEQWLECASDLYALGARRFMIGGKEPFADLLTLELACSLKHCFPDITIGSVCDGFTWQEYANDPRLRLFDFLECSVDGDLEAHDRVRGSGAFERCMKGLRKAKECIPHIVQSAAMAVGCINRFALTGAWNSIHSIGITNLFVQPMQPAGYARPQICLSAEEYATLISEILDGDAEMRESGSIVFYIPFGFGSPLSSTFSSQSAKEGVVWLRSGSLNLGILVESIRLPYTEHVIVDSSGALVPHFSLKEDVARHPAEAISVLGQGTHRALECARNRARDWWQGNGLAERSDGWASASEAIFGETQRFRPSSAAETLYNLKSG
jgi:hypothetical protein